MQLFQTPSTCCVGLCNADPIRWRQPRIPADSILAPSVVEIPSFPSPSSQSQPPPRLPCCANDQPALTDRTPLPEFNFFYSIVSPSIPVVCLQSKYRERSQGKSLLLCLLLLLVGSLKLVRHKSQSSLRLLACLTHSHHMGDEILLGASKASSSVLP